MNCNSIQEMLVEYLLRELDEPDDQTVNDHLRDGCPSCNAELADLQIAMQTLLESDIESAQPSSKLTQAAILSDVVSRGRTSIARSSKAVPQLEPSTRGRFRLATLLFPLSFAGGLLLGLYLWGEVDAPYGLQVVAKPNLGGLNVETQSTIVFTSLNSPTAHNLGEWQAVYDSYTQELHFFVRELMAPPRGSQWALVTYNENGEAKVLMPFVLELTGRYRAIVQGISLSEASQVDVVLQPIEKDAWHKTNSAAREALDV